MRAGLLSLLLVLAALPAAAQETPPAGPPPAAPDLVFEREIFTYPTYVRRNPFRPLIGSLAGGPRFEQIRLRGIIWSADPRRSVALLGSGSTDGPEPTQEELAAGGPSTRRLHVGETWGNTRVIEIERDRVVVEVEEFGLTERRTLELNRRRGEGGS